MRILKLKDFSKWAKSEKIADEKLKSAVKEMENGLHDANLGASLYKKRISGASGKGKSSGNRAILAYKKGDIAIFLYGFSKNEAANISMQEKKALKKLAKFYLGFTGREIQLALKSGAIQEIGK